MKIGNNIDVAVKHLKEEGLVAIPTETVYGLAANALNESAVVKIFEAKQRPSFDPLIVHTHSIKAAEQYVKEMPTTAKALFNAFAPGPLTIILPKSNRIPDIVTSGHPTVGIRIPAHPITLELLRHLDFPLAAPSANPFGYVSPTSAQHVADQLSDKVDYILDGGKSKVGVESTIIRCIDDSIEVLRLGGLAIEEIEKVLGQKVDQIKTSSSNPQAPGMLSSHYNPGKQIVIGDINENLVTFSKSKIGIISFSEEHNHEAIVQQKVLSRNGDLNEAAQHLFAALRSFDNTDIDIVLTELLPEQGLGRAINDRLKRAAAK